MRLVAELEEGTIARAVAVAVERERAQVAEQRLQPAHFLFAAAILAVEPAGAAVALVIREVGRGYIVEAHGACKRHRIERGRRGDEDAVVPARLVPSQARPR